MSVLVCRNLKMMIIIAGCLSSTISASSTSMVDLMYLPEYGKVEIDLGYKYDSKTTSNRLSTSRIIQYTEDRTKTSAYTKLSFSPFNEMKIGLGFDYQISDIEERKNTSALPYSKIKKMGLREPELFTYFRMLKEQDFNFNVDGIVSIAPSFDMGEEGVGTKETSAKRGGGLYSGTLLVGKKMEDFSFRGHLKVDYNGERELKDVFTGLKTVTYESRVDFTLGATAQLRFSQMHGIEVGADYITIGDEKQNLIINNIETKEDSYSVIALKSGYKGEFISGQMMGYLNFEFHKINDYNRTTGTSISENIDNIQKIINTGLVFKF